jgi:DUF971 family protein
MNAEAEHVAISKSRGVTIDWNDGLTAQLSNALLRDECPCATCTGAHGTEPKRTNHQNAVPDNNPLKLYTPKIAMRDVEAVGNYAIRIHWNDGHSTGIYTWAFLRELSERVSKARREGVN